MKDLNTIEKIVIAVMEDKAETRDDDDILYSEVIARLNPSLKMVDAVTFHRNRFLYGVPSFGSVCRTGRKARKENPHLASSKQSTEHKYKRWKEVRDYVLKV